MIADPANQIFVSAASAWEISTKHRIGKLPAAAHLVANFPQIALSQGFILLAITALHAIRAGSLQGAHRDPFDRMLAAQTLSENMVIVPNDPKLDLFGVSRIW